MRLIVDIEKELSGFRLAVKFITSRGILGLLGASGSGKSMTLRCIAGLDTPDRGRIVLNDRVLFDSEKGIHLPSRERKVGFLFQNYALFPHMTVAQNIGFALAHPVKEKRNRIVAEKIHQMQLEGLENRYPSQLSGGQQQRAALARALAVNPEVLLLDEPFSALDDHLRGQLEIQLMEILAGYRGAVLFVSHNMEEVYRVCDELILLSGGTMAAEGAKEAIFENPPTLAAAQITGCKNVSRARITEMGVIDAMDWSCRLRTTKTIPRFFSHVGIREQHISLATSDHTENVFDGWITDRREGLHSVSVNVALSAAGEEKPSKKLQWEVPKETWEAVKGKPQPWRIHIDPEKLFLTS